MKKIMAMAAAMFMGLTDTRADQAATQPTAATSAYRVLRIDNSDSEAYFDVVRNFEANYLKEFRFDSVWPQPPDNVDVEKSADGDSPLLNIFVDTHSTGAWAPQAADLVVSQLQSRLAALVQEQRATMKLQWKQWNMKLFRNENLVQDRIEIENKLKLIDGDIEEMGEQIGLPDFSPQNLDALQQSVAAQYETVQIDIAGKAARKDALSNAVATLAGQLRDRVGSDEIAQQLQVAVKQLEQDLDYTKSLFKTGTVGQGAVNAAIAALAEAKAKVIERQEDVAKGAGGDQLQQWNQDLLLLSVDLADLHAQSDALHNRLQVLGTVGDDMKHNNRDRLEARLNKIEEELDDFASAQSSEPALPGKIPPPKLTIVESH